MTTKLPDPSDLDALRREVGELRTALDETRETATSDDGLITATAGGRGELVELELDPRIYREQDSTVLAAGIVETVRRAAERAQRKAIEAAGPQLLGPGADPESIDVEFEPFLRELARATGKEED